MALGLRPPELPLTGSCPCKAVRFAVTAMPLLVYACHCTECQRWSGSAFSLAMPVAARHFALTRGAPKAYRRTTAGGIESTNWFCGDCGGGVFGERTAQPDVVTVRAGTLDDTSWLRPAAHQYLRSAQAWQRVPNRAECFEIMPNDFGALADLWGRMWRVNAGAD
ncbi:GFA family protein [Bradyrhizobium sp. NP1]|uniref:GFA family protein n=1 Tax=Bradyrhizobium sp. NP1 TaxID=3049772 RepID=UPI0025A52D83|nr:GFA family protein [Bradyrhizobium sp. NP1]WJR74867.1 GFA family protein [Bradyrhizobium sp. NP1]